MAFRHQSDVRGAMNPILVSIYIAAMVAANPPPIPTDTALT